MDRGTVEMLEYNRWANRMLLEAARILPPETLAARPAGLSAPIGSLFTHLVGGEQTFALRTKGRQHEGELNRASAFPGFDELLRISAETGAALIEAARTTPDDATVDLPYMGKRFRHLVRFFLVHAVTHAAEHRTEIKVGLNALGIATPDLDGWSYAGAMGYGAEV